MRARLLCEQLYEKPTPHDNTKRERPGFKSLSGLLFIVACAAAHVNFPPGPFNNGPAGNFPNVKWSIDCADAYAVVSVRHAVIEELARLTQTGDADLFSVETVLGELLGAEMTRGHIALAVMVEQSIGGPTVHIYTQGRTVGATHGELREAILRNTRLPMSIEVTPQGTHVCLRVPTKHETWNSRTGT